MHNPQLIDAFILVGTTCATLATWCALTDNDTLSALIFCTNAGIAYAHALLIHDRMNQAPQPPHSP